MNKITIVIIVGAFCVWVFLAWREYYSFRRLQAAELGYHEGFLRVEMLCKAAQIYRIGCHIPPGTPLDIHHLVVGDDDLCFKLTHWDEAGHFYFLNQVPPPGEPYAVYEINGSYVPNVNDHPEWKIYPVVFGHNHEVSVEHK